MTKKDPDGTAHFKVDNVGGKTVTQIYIDVYGYDAKGKQVAHKDLGFSLPIKGGASDDFTRGSGEGRRRVGGRLPRYPLRRRREGYDGLQARSRSSVRRARPDSPLKKDTWRCPTCSSNCAPRSMASSRSRTACADDGARIEVAFRLARHSSALWTQVDVALARPGIHFALREQTEEEVRHVARGRGTDVLVGHPEFDAAFVLEAAPTEVVRAMIDFLPVAGDSWRSAR